jgi:hypothetical protein
LRCPQAQGSALKFRCIINRATGVLVQGAGGTGWFVRVISQSNGTGVLFGAPVAFTISDSIISNNGSDGVRHDGAGAILLRNVALSNNANNGVRVGFTDYGPDHQVVHNWQRHRSPYATDSANRELRRQQHRWQYE